MYIYIYIRETQHSQKTWPCSYEMGINGVQGLGVLSLRGGVRALLCVFRRGAQCHCQNHMQMIWLCPEMVQFKPCLGGATIA